MYSPTDSATSSVISEATNICPKQEAQNGDWGGNADHLSKIKGNATV